jgi:uncharacterized protein involved in exopolysaccharide biosynthesis
MLETQLRATKEREGYLQTQLVNVSPKLEARQQNSLRLEQLRVQQVELKSRFTNAYPDVIKVTAEIANLERKMASDKDGADTDKELPDNPAYITLASQLSSTRAEIQSLEEQIESLKAKADQYQRQIETTPKVEETYRAMLSERNNTQAKYEDLMRKVMEARVSQGLEKEQKGERFTLLDPPRLPEKPFKPNRLAIMLIGFLLGIGAGVGTALLREFVDDTARSADDLFKAGLGPVLGGVPVLVTVKEMEHSKKMKLAAAAGTFALCVLGMLAFHGFVMDLDLFWVKLMRKFAVLFG